jgi:hypothetical protein
MRELPVRRLAAAACLSAIAVGICLIGPPSPTLASWADAETATSSTLVGGVVQGPVNVTCSVGNNVLNRIVTLAWSAPPAAGPNDLAPTQWLITRPNGTTATIASSVLTYQYSLGIPLIGNYPFTVQGTVGTWQSLGTTKTVHVLTVLISCD